MGGRSDAPPTHYSLSEIATIAAGAGQDARRNDVDTHAALAPAGGESRRTLGVCSGGHPPELAQVDARLPRRHRHDEDLTALARTHVDEEPRIARVDAPEGPRGQGGDPVSRVDECPIEGQDRGSIGQLALNVNGRGRRRQVDPRCPGREACGGGGVPLHGGAAVIARDGREPRRHALTGMRAQVVEGLDVAEVARAGEVTADGLIAIGQIAKRYSLYSKITGGQRIDLFGATLEQLPEIWQALVEAGFETGHAYGKSLRTVKSCVGSTWCRYGVQDSTGLAVRLEHRYKGLRAPHKIKMAVSGCTRECAEAQSKDVGVIATDKGWNLYLCGNGGMKPRHADLFASDLDDETLIRTVDRFLMFYIRTADRLQRTSTWMDNLEGGLDYLREVILNDSLGIVHELEQEMARVVETYQCEWQTTLNDPDRLALFRTAVNVPAGEENKRWQEICNIDEIPEQAGIGAHLGRKPIALFRFGKTVYALDDREPGSRANVLSRGILGDAAGEPVVISPLYKQRIRLRDGCQAESGAPAVRAWPVKIENGKVWVGNEELVMRAEAS